MHFGHFISLEGMNSVNIYLTNTKKYVFHFCAAAFCRKNNGFTRVRGAAPLAMSINEGYYIIGRLLTIS